MWCVCSIFRSRKVIGPAAAASRPLLCESEIALGKNSMPVRLSRSSRGTAKEARGVSWGILLFGIANAPTAILWSPLSSENSAKTTLK